MEHDPNADVSPETRELLARVPPRAKRAGGVGVDPRARKPGETGGDLSALHESNVRRIAFGTKPTQRTVRLLTTIDPPLSSKGWPLPLHAGRQAIVSKAPEGQSYVAMVAWYSTQGNSANYRTQIIHTKYPHTFGISKAGRRAIRRIMFREVVLGPMDNEIAEAEYVRWRAHRHLVGRRQFAQGIQERHKVPLLSLTGAERVIEHSRPHKRSRRKAVNEVGVADKADVSKGKKARDVQ